MKPVKIDEDELRRILNPYGSASPFDYWAILELLNEGVLDVTKDKYTGSDITAPWTESHRRMALMSPSEGREHLRMKIKAARFMDRRGHDIPKSPLKDSSEGEPLFFYSSFEESYHTPFNADVACSEDCTPAICEVGYTQPSRVLDAFGFMKARDDDEKGDSDAHFEQSVRHRGYVVDEFYVYPYSGGTSLEPDSIYCFRPKKLPEPDFGYLARITENAFSCLQYGFLDE